jgi:hypothetical protein
MSPAQFDYPSTGWSTGRMRKVGDTGENIRQDKAKLQQFAQQWHNGDIGWDKVNQEIESRGWSAQAPIRKPGDVTPMSPKDIFDMYRWLGEQAIKYRPSGEVGMKAMADYQEFMKGIGYGVIKLLDPKGQEHSIPVDSEDPRNR